MTSLRQCVSRKFTGWKYSRFYVRMVWVSQIERNNLLWFMTFSHSFFEYTRLFTVINSRNDRNEVIFDSALRNNNIDPEIPLKIKHFNTYIFSLFYSLFYSTFSYRILNLVRENIFICAEFIGILMFIHEISFSSLTVLQV